MGKKLDKIKKFFCIGNVIEFTPLPEIPQNEYSMRPTGDGRYQLYVTQYYHNIRYSNGIFGEACNKISKVPPLFIRRVSSEEEGRKIAEELERPSIDFVVNKEPALFHPNIMPNYRGDIFGYNKRASKKEQADEYLDEISKLQNLEDLDNSDLIEYVKFLLEYVKCKES